MTAHSFLSRSSQRCSRAFTMLETTIAIAILGVGLIMVAAIFPAALTQHQNSADQAGALELTTKADAILKARVLTNQLYFPATTIGVDSPWYLLPTAGMIADAPAWDSMLQGTTPNDNIYANFISGFDNLVTLPSRIGNFPDYLPTGFPTPRQYGLYGSDQMADRDPPYSDSQLQSSPNHLIWYGFYRRLATGTVRFSVAVCKQRRNAIYTEQDMSSHDAGLLYQNPFNTPAGITPNRRLPVPWRVTVGFVGGQQLSNDSASQMFGAPGTHAGLAQLAPVGSRIMIQGTTYQNGVSVFPVPAGRVLTVSRTIGTANIEVIENLEDLPPLNFNTGVGTTFDVWVFPPATESGAFGHDSPLLAWRTSL